MLAKVTLKESITFSTSKRKWKKDHPQTISDENEIKNLQCNSRFLVEIIEQPKQAVVEEKPVAEPTPEQEPKQAAKKVASSKKTTRQSKNARTKVPSKKG